jgi:SAM-dependent methyltransferase
MVHALEEVRRVLKPGGILIDIRPLSGAWPIEVASIREVKETGHVDDFPEPLNADRASNEAMQDVEARGWFSRDRQEFFSYSYSWDMPTDMEEWIADEWQDFVALGEETKRSTRSAWALGDADARVRLQVRMLISRWSVRKDS